MPVGTARNILKFQLSRFLALRVEEGTCPQKVLHEPKLLYCRTFSRFLKLKCGRIVVDKKLLHDINRISIFSRILKLQEREWACVY
jgi:hypothetical protein